MAKTLEELQKKYSRYTQNGQAEQPTFRNDFLSSQYKAPDNSGYQTRNVLSPSVGAGKTFNDLYSLQDKYSKYFVNNPDDNSKRLAMDLLMSGRSTAPVSEPVQTGAQSVTEPRKQNAADKVFSFIRDALTSGNNPSLGLKGSTVSPEKMLSSLRSGPSNPNAPEYDSGYRRLMSEPGFFRNSSYVSTEKPDGTAKVNAATGSFNPDDLFEDVIYDYINGNEKARDIVDANSVTSGRAFTGDDVSYLKEMTPDEVAVYNYLYRAGGRDQANRYIENIKPQLLYRSRGTEAEAWKKMADEQPVSSSLFSIAVGPLKSVSYAGQVGEMIGGGQIDPNAGYNRFVRIPGAIREEISEKAEAKWGERGSFGYQTTMSMGDFLYNSLISGGFSGGAVPEKIAEGLTLAIMGTGAAADTVVQKKDMGYDDTSAFVLGTIAGAAEIVTEKISLETLLNPDLLRNGSLKYILKNMAAEASEEGASDLINWYAEYICDIVSGQTESEWKRMLREYEAQGYTESEAFGMAIADRAKELGSDVLGGMISGGVMAGTGAAGNTVRNAAYGSYYKNAGQEAINDLVNRSRGGNYASNEVIKRLADEIGARASSDNWRNVRSSSIGNLATQMAVMDMAREEQMRSAEAITEAPEAVLEEETRTEQPVEEQAEAPKAEYTAESSVKEQQAEMVYSVSRTYNGEAARTIMPALYDNGIESGLDQDPDDFVKGFHEYYMAGQNGTKMDSVGNTYGLSDYQRDEAYRAGHLDALRGDFYGEERTDNGYGQQDTRNKLARKTAGAVYERRANTKQRLAEQAERAAEARALTETEKEVSPGSLNISYDFSGKGVKLVPSAVHTGEMTRIASDNLGRGLQTRFFTGEIVTESGNENVVLSSDGKTVYIRADHETLSADQLNKKASFQAYKKANPEIAETIRNRLLTVYGDQIDRLADAYAEEYADSGMSADEVMDEILADAYAGIDVFEHMSYYEGATRFTSSVRTAVNEARRAERLNRSSGKKGSVNLSSDTRGLNAQQRAGVRVIERLVESGVLKNNFIFYQSVEENRNGKTRRVLSENVGNLKKGDLAPNGFYSEGTGNIYIDLNAGLDGKGTVLFTISHELTHFIKEWSADKFNTLANFVKEQYAEQGIDFEELVQNRMKAENLDYDHAFDEVIADSMQTMFTDGSMAEKLAELRLKDRTLAEKIMDFIRDIQKVIREAYQNLKPDSYEGKLVRSLGDSFEKMADLYAEGLASATENYAETADSISNEDAFADSETAVRNQIRTPYTEGTNAWKEFVDGLNPEAKKTHDLFYDFYTLSKLTNAKNAQGKTVKKINISSVFMTAQQWNDKISQDSQWKECAKKLAASLPAQVRKNMNFNLDGTLTPVPLETMFKMQKSLAQRLIDSLGYEKIDNTYELGGKKIELNRAGSTQSVGGEAYRRALIAETRKLYDEGKLKKVSIQTMSKDRWGSLGFLAANEKTGASGDLTTLCPQMMYNKGCFYCYRRAALETGVNNKLVAQSVWYTGEILRIKDADVQKLNERGGLRIQSFGDWMPHFSAQLADILYDAQTRGLQVKIITKEPSMIDYVARLREQGIGLNLYFNISADYAIEKGPEKMNNLDPNSLARVNPERPFMRDDNNTFWWKRALTVEEGAKIRQKYPWVNVRIVATTQDEFIRGLKDPNVQVVTGYHGNIRNWERIDSTTGEHKVIVEPLGDAGMPRFAYVNGSWVREYDGKTKTHQALADAIEKNGLQQEYYIKTCCITGRCAQCQGKCGSYANNFYVKNATNDPEGTAYWYDNMIHEEDEREGSDGYRASRRITDKATLDFLENQEHITTYRTMQVIDGGLYSPMNSLEETGEDGKRKLGFRSELGRWEMATEAPERTKAKTLKNGEVVWTYDLKDAHGNTDAVAYNPYEHSANYVLNDQFTGAYKRNNIVVVECIVPASEANGAYRAEKAHNATGWTSWHKGPVAAKIAKATAKTDHPFDRQLFLSRYLKPVRIVPDAEVAQMYGEYLRGTDVKVNWNVVSPGLLKELVKQGVPVTDVPSAKSVKDKMPDVLGASIRTAEDAYEAAAPVQDELNRVCREISEDLGFPYSDVRQKSIKSMKDKVERKTKSGSEYSIMKMKDHTRSMIMMNDFTDINSVLDALDERNIPFETEAVVNDWGYRGFHVTWRQENGIGSEVQLTKKDHWALKQWSDKIYDKWRNADIAKLSAEEQLQYKADLKRSRERWAQFDMPDLSPYERRSSALSGRAQIKSSPNIGLEGATQTPSMSSRRPSPLSMGERSNTLPSSVTQKSDISESSLNGSENTSSGNDIIPQNGQKINAETRYSSRASAAENFNELYETLPDGRLRPNVDDLSTEDWKIIYQVTKKLGYGIKSAAEAKEVYSRYAGKSGFNKEQSEAIKAAYGIGKDTETATINPKRMSAAKKEFGTTTNFSEAGYLLRDGSMLDFSGKREGGPAGVRYMDHREISRVFEQTGDNSQYGGMTQYMDAFINEGNIRLMDGQGVTIGETEPSDKQYSLLKQFIDRQLRNEKYFYLDLSNKDGITIESRDYGAGDSSSKIINDIKSYFKNGELPYRSQYQNFRYSERNSEGEFLTSGQQEYFKDSKVRDEDGNLMVLYHGTESKRFNVFENMPMRNGRVHGEGFYFTSKRHAAQRWGTNVYKVYLNLKNPYIESKTEAAPQAVLDIVRDNYYRTYDKLSKDKDWWGNKYTKEEFFTSSERMYNNSSSAINQAVRTDDMDGNMPEYKFYQEIGRRRTEILKSLGYDGVIAGDEYVAFYPEQIKETTNKTPTEDPDIRYSDRDYMSAVESNDMETAQQMVNEAAERAGYNSPDLYHGTSGPFTVFRNDKGGSATGAATAGIGFYLTDDRSIAEKFSKISKDPVRRAFGVADETATVMRNRVRFNNPLVYERGGEEDSFKGLSDALLDYAKEYTSWWAYPVKSQKELTNLPPVPKREIAQAFARSLRRKGYDGVIIRDTLMDGSPRHDFYVAFDSGQIKSMDPVTYDDSGNVVPLSERFNSGNGDIRYSSRSSSDALSSLKSQNELLKSQLADVRNELKRMQAQNEKLRGEFELTGGTKVDPESLRKAARAFQKEYQTKVDVKNIASALEKMREKILAVDADIDQIKQDALPVAREIAETTTELVNGEMQDQYREMKSLLNSKRGIMIPDSAKSDITDGYNTVRKRLFGKINLTNDGLPIDKAYMQMQELFGTSIFPDGVTHPAEQLQLFEDTLNDFRPVYDNPYTYNMAEAVEGIANDLTLVAMDDTIKTKAPTFADKAQAEKEEAVRQAVKQAIARERSARNELVQQIKDKYKVYRLEQQFNRAKSDLRGKIERGVARVNRLLLSPTDKRHIPQELQKPTAKLLSLINLDNGRRIYKGEARSDALKELQRLYKAFSDDITLDADFLGDEFHDGLIDNMVAMGGKSFYEMDLSELETCWKCVQAIEATIRSANRMFTEGKYATISELAYTIMEDNSGKNVREFKLDKVQKLVSVDMLTPEALFHRLGKAGDWIFKQMRGAQDKAIRIQEEAVNFAKSLKDLDIQKLENEKLTVRIGNRDAQISRAQLMDLYNLSKREQALQHLIDRNGGISLAKTGKQKKWFAESNAGAFRGVTMDQIKNALTLLSPEEIKAAEAMQKFLVKLADYGNETSMKVYGYEKFGDPNYWPIRSNEQDLKNDQGRKEGMITSVAGVGMAQPLNKNANSSIKLRSAFDTFSEHVTEMSNYTAWLPVMEDINRLRNYNFKDDTNTRTLTMQEVLDSVLGPGGAEYIQNLMGDLANGVKSEKQFFGGFMGKFRATAVGANLRVIIQQPTAIFRAMDMINPVYLAEGAAKNYAKGWKTAKKYSAIATWKDWGFFDIHTGRQMKEILFENSTPLSWLQEKAMAGAGWADSVGWGWLWNSCYAEQKAKHKGEGLSQEQLNELTAKRFDDVIDHTQVVDGVLQRSQIMRNGDALTKMATAFMGEPTKQYNMFVTALYDLRNGGSKEAKMRFVRATTTLLISGAINAVAQSIMDAVRKDDREKKYWERFCENFTGVSGSESKLGDYIKNVATSNLGDTVNPLTYVPYAKDIWSIMNGYDVERMDMSLISSLSSAVKYLYKSLQGGGQYTVHQQFINTASEFAKLLGLPATNVKKDILGVADTLVNEFDNYRLRYEMDKFIYRTNNSNKNLFLDNLYKAYKAGDDDYEYIYNDIIEKGYYTKEQINARLIDKGAEDGVKFIPPESRSEYDSYMKTIQNNAAYKKADEEHRETALKTLTELYQKDTNNQKTLREKAEAGSEYGVTEADLILYKLAFSVVDEPSYGSASNEERKAALDLMGASGKKADWMWLNVAHGSDKSNPYK